MKNRKQQLMAGMMFGFTIGIAMGTALGHWTWMVAMGLGMAAAFSHIFVHNENYEKQPEELE
jgi:F0F1-type ATP synthase assembly protein I